MALTVKKIDKLLRKGEQGRHLDSGTTGVRGLYLEIGGRTNAHWLLRYQLRGRTRWMGFGSARTFSLDEARARAKIERQKLADKIDPLVVRRAERAKAAAAPETLTFAKAAQAYFDQHEAKWTNRKHAAQFLSSLKTYVFPRLGASRCCRDRHPACAVSAGSERFPPTKAVPLATSGKYGRRRPAVCGTALS